MRAWWLIPAAIIMLATAEAAAEDVIYAVPNNDWRLVLQRFEPQAIRGPDSQPVPKPVMSLSEALLAAAPGATIQLLPGVYCHPSEYPNGLCDGMKPLFNGFLWDTDNYSFRHDVSNHPDFPVGLRAQGYRVNGIAVSGGQPLFVDAPHGNMMPIENAPTHGAGCIVHEDEGGLLTCTDPPEKGAGPDAGPSGWRPQRARAISAL